MARRKPVGLGKHLKVIKLEPLKGSEVTHIVVWNAFCMGASEARKRHAEYANSLLTYPPGEREFDLGSLEHVRGIANGTMAVASGSAAISGVRVRLGYDDPVTVEEDRHLEEFEVA